MPKISINIPCYNRSRMLAECIESFIKQSFKDFEIVVADDGSEEDLRFIKEMDPRVKHVIQRHLGISRAFNLAMDNSSGEYIMPFGSDDLALPKLLQDTLSLMERYKNKYDVIYPNFWIQKNGRLYKKLNTKTLNPAVAYQEMLKKQYIPHSGTLWKKECYPRYDETLESAVDLELFLTAMENGVKFKHLKSKLFIYRTEHEREFNTKRQIDCCDKILRKRGFAFDEATRLGYKL
jgi:glycosyltransferase involved in cell wall biosynthesis